jgi:hypothetical protein
MQNKGERVQSSAKANASERATAFIKREMSSPPRHDDGGTALLCTSQPPVCVHFKSGEAVFGFGVRAFVFYEQHNVGRTASLSGALYHFPSRAVN